VSVPLVRESAGVGVIQLRRAEVNPFSDKQIALLQTFADQAVIAIENVRLFKELAARNRDLTEALEQQTATSEILRVISTSPTDLQPVLNAIAESAARLCDANDAIIQRVDGDTIRPAAHYGSIPVQRQVGWPVNRGSVAGRAVVDRKTVHVHDLAAVGDDEYPVGKLHQQELGHSNDPCHAAATGANRHRRHPDPPHGGPSLCGQANQAPRDFRRSGGDRHRKRAVVQGAGGADPGADPLRG
jgi:hypothetical protein